MRDQCLAANVSLPFFMKQMSGKKPIPPDLSRYRQFPSRRLRGSLVSE